MPQVLRRDAVASILFGGVTALLGCGQRRPVVTLACAAGWQQAVSPLVEQWSAESGADVRTMFDGSGRLAATLTSGATVDLFLAADRSYLKPLLESGTFASSKPVCEQSLRVVAVDSSYEQVSFDDMISGRVRLSLARDETAAVSRVARRHLGDEAWAALMSAAVAQRLTVTEVAADVAALGVADVGIIWGTTWPTDDRLLTVAISELVGVRGAVEIAIADTQNTLAVELATFLAENLAEGSRATPTATPHEPAVRR